ncbi:enoyl-CoA hydratase [Caballeronia novacaledonica]|uniref:Enoyl-CoA hydratase n=1 Tax=Caballeronia novacaledonica TaxID=1544861 RepID=A0A2U3I0Z6_9BURK|nr:enoyl-CoA hydratase/isomerase family protein [Caballeronia novacaledonica]SPB13767.1 enoyl-CoA hydratase [Caballeronia novacaledonica]
MPTETIRLRHAELRLSDGVAEFSHQRPEQRNTLTAELRQDYVDLLDRLESDRTISALIITGSGGSFCAGGDLKAVMERRSSPDPHSNMALAMRDNLAGAHVWLSRLRNLDMPVIAAVDGAAYGAGASLSLAADFVMATDRAAFCMSFHKVGMIPDMGALYTLPRVVGLTVARDLFLTARRVGAQEARQIGLVHSVFDADSLLAETRRFARRFQNAPRGAAGVTKRLLNMSFETPYAALAQMESNAQAVETCSRYHADAIERFLRGEPSFYDWDRDAPA